MVLQRWGAVIRTVGGLAVLVLVAVVLSRGASAYTQQLINLALAYAVIVLGLNIMLGWAGLIDLSIAGFVGVGAYVTGVAVVNWEWPIWGAMLLSILTAAIIALLFGIPTLRLKTHYFAMATLAFSLIAELVFQNEAQLTGGAPGLRGIPRPTFGETTLDLNSMMWFLLAALIAVIVVSRAVWLSSFGKKLRALKGDPMAAELVGIPVARVRLTAFVLAASVYAFGGALYALQMRFISPDVFDLELMVLIFASLVVGGSGVITGAVFGAGLITFLPEWLRFLDLLYMTFFGGLILVFLLAAPAGIVPLVFDASRRLLATTPLRHVIFPAPVQVDVPVLERPDVAAESVEPMPSRTTLRVDEVSISFGGVQALRRVSLEVGEHDIHALIGPNGAGKTTLINCITGAYRNDSGTIFVRDTPVTGSMPHRIVWSGVTRTFQTVRVFGELTVWENLVVAGRGFLGHGDAIEVEAQRWARFLGLQGVLDRKAAELSFGQLRRLELARALAMPADLILLDEPASGLSGAEIKRLEEALRFLRQQGRALLLVEHNMGFVMRIADRITVLDFGRVISQGSPLEVRKDKRVIEAYLGTEEGSIA